MSPDSLTIAIRSGQIMTLRLDELILGDLVLGFDEKTQEPAFSKLILWVETDFRGSIKYTLLELEDGTKLMVKGDQLIIVRGPDIHIPQPDLIIPGVVEDDDVTVMGDDVKTVGEGTTKSGSATPLPDYDSGEDEPPDYDAISTADSVAPSVAPSRRSRAQSRSSRAQSRRSRAQSIAGTVLSAAGTLASAAGTALSTDNISQTSEAPLLPPKPPDIIIPQPDLVLTSSNFVMTKTLQPGDILYKRNVGYIELKEISPVTQKGFCRPITTSGTILINNVAVSCYHNLKEKTITEDKVFTAQQQGMVGYAPLVFFRKFFKGNVAHLNPMDEPEEPHCYGVLFNKIFRVKK